MTMISERLRAVDHMSVEDCFLQSHLYSDAADTIDALVAVAERISSGEWSDPGHTALREAADAALAKAKGKQA